MCESVLKLTIKNGRMQTYFSSNCKTLYNIKKIEELTKQGLMKPAGLASFENRKESKSKYMLTKMQK